MSVKALIFDMDGTLIDNEPYYEKAWAALFSRLGVPIDAKTFNKQTGGMSFPDIFAKLLPDLNVQAQSLTDEVEAHYFALLETELRPAPGLMRFLSEAETAGLPMAVASSARLDNIDRVIDGLNIRNRFQTLLSPDLGYKAKPEPDLFLAAAEAMRIAPQDCLVFEDALAGVEAARRAGMRVVALTTSLSGDIFQDKANVRHIMPDFTHFSLDLIV